MVIQCKFIRLSFAAPNVLLPFALSVDLIQLKSFSFWFKYCTLVYLREVMMVRLELRGIETNSHDSSLSLYDSDKQQHSSTTNNTEPSFVVAFLLCHVMLVIYFDSNLSTHRHTHSITAYILSSVLLLFELCLKTREALNFQTHNSLLGTRYKTQTRE